jgi:hypothetical protein
MRIVTMRAALTLAVAIVLEVVSLYGWWSYFTLGPQHGAGFEIATLAGQLALAAFIGAAWMDLRYRP